MRAIFSLVEYSMLQGFGACSFGAILDVSTFVDSAFNGFASDSIIVFVKFVVISVALVAVSIVELTLVFVLAIFITSTTRFVDSDIVFSDVSFLVDGCLRSFQTHQISL